MPAMGKLQMAAIVQTPMADPPYVNRASSMAPKRRNHSPEDTNTYKKTVGGSTLKETPTCRRPWHYWHTVAAVAHWQSQQLQSSLVSAVAEPHHADLMLLEAPSRRGLGNSCEEK